MKRRTLPFLALALFACGSDDASSPVSALDGGSKPPPSADGAAPHGDGSAQGDDDASPDAAPPPPPKVNVLTQHNDNLRTGANLAETALTPANVTPSTFGKLFCRDVDDEIYGQPLVVTDVDIPGKGKRDVVYVATVNDTVYAFDANDPDATDPLWSQSFLSNGVVPPRNTDIYDACNGHYSDVSGNMGILSTPVIDLASKTMYLLARTKEGSDFVQKLHALDIVTGKERAKSPAKIDASVPGTGDGSTTVTFDPFHQNQRAALLLHDGLVYVGWSSHCDAGPYHGWFLGFDATTLQRVVTYVTTPDGENGGIWMSGQGPAVDAAGDIYISVGNGAVGTKTNPKSTRNRGESFLRLRRNGATLDVKSWFTPYEWDRLEAYDLDLGSAGLLLVPDSNVALSAGKGGTMYVVDRTDMGGVGDNDDSQIVQSFELATHHLHGGPAYWKGPSGPLVYTWAEYDYLKAFTFDGTKLGETPVAKSADPAPDGMPGAMLSISANGVKDGVLWATLPFTGNANQAVVPGVMRAFDASDVSTEIWSSHDVSDDEVGKLSKNAPPTVANGKVYVSTFSQQLCVFGLLAKPRPGARHQAPRVSKWLVRGRDLVSR